MVQYIFTPWRDRQELLLVRHQLYGGGDNNRPASSPQETGQHDSSHDDRRTRQNLAVARISMWVQRGNCPHMVESTALLFAAVLSDEIAATQSAGSSTYAVRAAYSAAFSRFVTGLLDGHQDKLRKQSMYSIAKVIGLPATFVELRHQATHEQLPTLAKLRPAAQKALDWIWDYYWKQLSQDAADGSGASSQDPCRAAVLKYLGEEDAQRRQKILRQLGKWDLDQLLATIKDLQASLPGSQVYLKCMMLRDELKGWERVKPQWRAPEKDKLQASPAMETDTVSQQTQSAIAEADDTHESEDESDIGWSRFQGQWKPKPIGIV